uniref:Secreted protein n=1 Tax=Glossina palpalis gambiensis TaxID=67801 RepID=A0A1B0B2N7_9MUSC
MNLSILISINVAFAAAACPHHYRHHHYRYRLNGRLDLLEAKVARHQPNDCPSKAMSSQYAKYATKILCDDEGVWPFIPV